MKNYRLHLIRHGMTQGNADGIFVGGGIDIPLNEDGVAQLREMEGKYRYPTGGVLFLSPMRRAVETGEILYPEMQNRVVLEELREYRFGAFEGRKVKELMSDPNFTAWMDPTSEYAPDGGESGAQFAARTTGAMMTMMEYMAKRGIHEGICIAHGGVIMTMLASKALPKRPLTAWMTANGAGFTVQAGAAMVMRDGLVEAVSTLPEGFQPPTYENHPMFK